MTDIVRARLRQRIEELGTNPTKVSLQAVRSRTLLRDFLSGKSRSMLASNMEAVARVLGVSVGWLSGQDHRPDPAPISAQSPMAPRAISQIEETRDIPVFGTAAGAVLGSIAISSDVIDWLPRPRGLRGARDAYALYVTGVSMQPRYTTGDIVFVHPHRPLRSGDIAVIQIQDSEGGLPASYLKEFRRKSESELVAQQYNPPAEVKFSLRTVKALHRVLTMNEVVGV